MYIPPSIIEEVKSKANIVDVVGEYIALRKEGQNYVGLCPFHPDHHPSLSVSPTKDIFKCFSCGKSGDVIKFLMEYKQITFPEAVKLLADKYSIVINEDNVPNEDKVRYKKLEAMFAANKIAARYFVDNLYNGSEESNKALAYVRERWSEDAIKTFEIGYANKGWGHFVDFATANGLDVNIITEVGLVTKNANNDNNHDVFRGRIMFPILDSQERITGFIARLVPTINDKTKEAKYINTKESGVFIKGNNIYGIDKACWEARRCDEINLVEGTPDVMQLHSIGFPNSVAALGTAWSDYQMKAIKRYTNNINIIPDSDMPRENKKFGAGFESAFRTGKIALSAGMNVTVQEIPLSGTKCDPGDYLKSAELKDSLPKKDFLLWYADKLFTATNGNINAKAKVAHDIVTLVKSVKDSVKQEYYTDELIKVYGKQDMWKREILGVQSSDITYGGSLTKTEYESLFDGKGISVGNNCYLRYTDKGEEEISNFIMIPLYHLKDGETATRLFTLRNFKGDEVRIEFFIDELTTLQKFRNRVETEGDYMWYGTSNDLHKVRGILLSCIETVTKISTLGWQHNPGIYAYGNGIIYNNIWYPVDDEGIVRLPDNGSYFLPAFAKQNVDNTSRFYFEQKFIHKPDSKIRFYAFANQMFDVYGDNAIIGICYIIVCLFRDIVIRARREFPSLNLFGPKGTGKTAFGELIQSPFIYRGEHPNLRTSTMASLATVLAQAENGMVHLDEYKNDLDTEKIELMKGLWDCQGRSKLNIDTNKREQSQVLSGVVISGQEKPTIDIALYSRLCVLPFTKDTHNTEEKANFRILKDYEIEGTSYVIFELLRIRKQFEADYASCYEQAVKDICSKIDYSIDDRILHNWSVVFAAYMASYRHINFPFSYDLVYKAVVSGVEYQYDECLHSNELSVFWKTVDYLKRDNAIFGLCDYRVNNESTLQVIIKVDGKNKNFRREFKEAKNILKIPTNSRIFSQYMQHLQRTHNKPLPEGTLKSYLENSSEYLGKLNSVRFAAFENVKDWPRQYEVGIACNKDGNGSYQALQPRISEKPVQAYCFDLDAVESAYGICLYSDYMEFDLKNKS